MGLDSTAAIQTPQHSQSEENEATAMFEEAFINVRG